jgi:hypothetical protein
MSSHGSRTGFFAGLDNEGDITAIAHSHSEVEWRAVGSNVIGRPHSGRPQLGDLLRSGIDLLLLTTVMPK